MGKHIFDTKRAKYNSCFDLFDYHNSKRSSMMHLDYHVVQRGASAESEILDTAKSETDESASPDQNESFMEITKAVGDPTMTEKKDSESSDDTWDMLLNVSVKKEPKIIKQADLQSDCSCSSETKSSQMEPIPNRDELLEVNKILKGKIKTIHQGNIYPFYT